MHCTRTFAIDASQRLPNEELRADGDIISIIELLIPVIVPLIERCFENNNMQGEFGVCCQQLAKEAQSNWRKRMIFGYTLRQELGGKDYRQLGGRHFRDAFIEQAAATDPQTLTNIHAENCDH